MCWLNVSVLFVCMVVSCIVFSVVIKLSIVYECVCFAV